MNDESGAIKFKVVDSLDHRATPFVSVLVFGNGGCTRQTRTDIYGNATIKRLPPGPAHVKCVFPGYHNLEMDITVPSGILDLNILEMRPIR